MNHVEANLDKFESIWQFLVAFHSYSAHAYPAVMAYKIVCRILTSTRTGTGIVVH
jgi:hypothetical protein